MHKKQSIVLMAIFSFCLSSTLAFAKSNSVHHVVIKNYLNRTSGGEFSKVSANFHTPSFTIKSNNGEFARPSENFNHTSFSMGTKTGEFSRTSFSIH